MGKNEEPEGPERNCRVVIYVPPAKHRTLRSKLALRGLSVSEWVRRLMEKYLRE